MQLEGDSDCVWTSEEGIREIISNHESDVCVTCYFIVIL